MTKRTENFNSSSMKDRPVAEKPQVGPWVALIECHRNSGRPSMGCVWHITDWRLNNDIIMTDMVMVDETDTEADAWKLVDRFWQQQTFIDSNGFTQWKPAS